MNKKRKTVRTGIEKIQSLLDLIIRKAISMGAFSTPVNVAIDEHDHPYYGADSRYLIGVGSKKFRGTDKAYRFATLESVKKGERFVLSVMRRDQLDGIDNSKEVRTLIEHAVYLGIKINIILMDRGYLDAGVMNGIDTMGMKYIVPARDNPKVLRLKKKDTNWSERKEVAKSNFVHVKYHKDGKLHDFCFYTNIDVNEDNVENLAETYRERWSIETGYRMIRKFLARTTSKRNSIWLLYFYLAILLYNMWVLMNIVVRVKIIAENLKVFIASKLIESNPFVTNPVRSNGHSGGDF
ncbi:MAG: transposase [Thermoplasmataceae archaeon]